MDPSLIYFLTVIVLPLLVTGGGVAYGVHKYGQWRQANYLLTKSTLSGRLLEADEHLSYVEAASSDDPFAAKRAAEARAHLNAAFASYSANFGTDSHKGTPFKSVSMNINQSLDQVDRKMAIAAAEPGSVERLKYQGAEFGKAAATLALTQGARLLEGGVGELNRIVAQAMMPVDPAAIARSRVSEVLAQGHVAEPLLRKQAGQILAQGEVHEPSRKSEVIAQAQSEWQDSFDEGEAAN